MSPTIDLTASDDGVPPSKLRRKRKLQSFTGYDEDETAFTQSKRVLRSSGDPPQSLLSQRRPGPGLSAFEDDNDGDSTIMRHGADRQVGHRSSGPTSTPITDDESEDETDEAFELEEIARTTFEQAAHRRVAKRAPDRYKLVNFALYGGRKIEPGTGIQLRDGRFLRIVHIFWDNSRNRDDIDAYILRGILLVRNCDMDGKFPRVTNELVAMISVPMDDRRSHLLAGVQDRALRECVCIREIRFTNAVSPKFSFREDEDRSRWHYLDVETNEWKLNRGVAFQEACLVCRYKYVDCWGPNLRQYSAACLRLEPDEADQKYRMSNAQLLRNWFLVSRGRADGESSKNTLVKGDMVDFYCGSGGASEAARLAGLNVAFAVDSKECAAESHQKNHPNCMTIHSDVFNIFTSDHGAGNIICDVCHASNPCQSWSPLNTRPGKNNAANEASAFTVDVAAKKVGSRIMIFEQTPGFVRMKKHRTKWNMFVQQFTSMDFSFKWRIISTADHGCSNRRPRLWCYAAAPGQQMPEDIQPTHGPPGSGLLPYVTVRQALAYIPVTATLHDPAAQAEKFRKTGRPKLQVAKWDEPLKHLIPTQGPRALHPENRPFTIREAMCLQGFPHSYDLVGKGGGTPSRTEAMTMIGDAVAPHPSAPHYASAKKALRVTDEELAAYGSDVIDLVD